MKTEQDAPPLPVAAALILRNGNILVARRSGDRHLAGKWEFPGGKIEADETPQDCLVRELREELGMEIEVGGLYASSEHRYAAGVVRLAAYLARPLSEPGALSAHSELRWAAPEELPGLDLAPADVPIALKLAAEGSGPRFGPGHIFFFPANSPRRSRSATPWPPE